jgi:predicted metal-dependent hydrolase
MPKAAIDGFVEANAAWIARQRAKLDEVHSAASDAGALTEADIKELAERMRKVLPQKLARIAESMGVGYGRVSVRCQRSKWGSCTAEGNLNFNCLLMLAPEEVLDYVLIHELCHRRHMDHSKEFWADVERLDRDYREHKKWLRENGAVLMRRVKQRNNDHENE